MSGGLASNPASLNAESDAGLTLDEEIELKQLESEIQLGQRNFVAVGNALASIRDRRLYRPRYATFEDYCDQRWQIARSRAYQFIDAAAVFENVQHVGHLPPENARQACALTDLKDPTLQREAWSRAVETAPEGRVTAKHVAEVVRQIQGVSDQPPAEPASLTIHEAIGLLRPCVYSVYEQWPEGELAILVRQLRGLAHELETNGELCP